jgi:hypothetical protein
MKLRSIFAGALALVLSASLALAQTNQGTSPLTPTKGGTNSAFVGFTGPATSIKTFTLPNASGTIGVLNAIATWTAAQSFTDGTLILLGSSSGSSTLKAPATGGGTATLFPGSDTIAGIAATQTLTNKTFNCANNTCTVRIANDVSGLGTGVSTALAVNVGAAGAFVTFNGALGTPSSGTVTNLTGTATININGTVGATTPAAGTFTAAIANSFVPNLSTVPSNGLYLPAANTLGWAINSAAELQLTSTALFPAVDGGSSLGTTALGWQNLFGNTGFVWNIENGNWVATHTSGILTVGTGDFRITTAGTNSASAVTVGGTQTLTNKTLTSPAISGPAVTGTADIQQAVVFTGDITPTQLAANTNDWAPTGFSTASALRLSTDASRNITGIAAGADGRIIILHNVGSFDAVLKNEDANSTAGNRFLFGGDVTLLTNYSITLRYDSTSSRWRAITTAAAGGGGGGTVTSATIAAGNGAAVSGTCTITTSGTCTVAADASFLQGFISGLTLSNDSGDVTNDIAIAPGVATSAANDFIIKLSSGLVKRTDAAWAVGSGNGGMDTGSVANGTVHVWLIQRSDTGVTDALFSASATAPTMPTNYDRRRRIGSLRREAAVMIPFVQNGDFFYRGTPSQDITTDNPGTSAVTATLTGLPTGLVFTAIITVNYNAPAASSARFYASSLAQTDVVPSAATVFQIYAPVAAIGSASNLFVPTNTSAQIRYRVDASEAGTVARIISIGWVDSRGK